MARIGERMRDRRKWPGKGQDRWALRCGLDRSRVGRPSCKERTVNLLGIPSAATARRPELLRVGEVPWPESAERG